MRIHALRRRGDLGWLTALAIVWLAWSEAARTQTDEIQVYDAQIAAPGAFNLTWHDNYTPDGRTSPDYLGGIVPNHTLNGVPEWAYGVTRWFKAGLYMPLYSLAGHGSFTFNGFKLRALFVEPDAASHRFVYGINFEFSYNTEHWNQNRYTQEIRPIIGWHLGQLDVVVNPIQLARLIAHCRNRGISLLVAEVLQQNARMLRLAERFGFRRQDAEFGTVRLVLELRPTAG